MDLFKKLPVSLAFQKAVNANISDFSYIFMLGITVKWSQDIKLIAAFEIIA